MVYYTRFGFQCQIFFVVRVTQANSGGPGTTSACQDFFTPIVQNFLKLSRVCPGFPRFAVIMPSPAETCQAIYFRQLCKKYLTSSAHYCIIGAARRLQSKKLCTNAAKKFLTSRASCVILPGWARGLPRRLARLKIILCICAKKT